MNQEVNDIWSIKDKDARHKALVDRAVRSARTINQGFKRMIDKGISYNDTAYRYAEKNLVMNEKEGINTVSTAKGVYDQMTDRKLRAMLNKMNDIRASETSRVSTIRNVYDRRIKGSLNALKGNANIGQDEAEKYEFFLKHGGGDLMNDYGSTGALQVYENWKDFINRKSNKTTQAMTKEFLENYGYFKIVKGDRFRTAKNKSTTENGVRIPLNKLAKRLANKYKK